jgi:hypothetical protein
MAVPHENVCLLRNTRLALAATVLFAAVGVVYFLVLTGSISVAGRDPLSPYVWVASAVFVVSLLRLPACSAERVILGLLLVDVLFKSVLVLGPHRFASIVRYQQVTAVVIFFSCAAISGFAAYKGHRQGTSS